jgi:hypothetical protein
LRILDIISLNLSIYQKIRSLEQDEFIKRLMNGFAEIESHCLRVETLCMHKAVYHMLNNWFNSMYSRHTMPDMSYLSGEKECFIWGAKVVWTNNPYEIIIKSEIGFNIKTVTIKI